jgi:hypothetical protein
MDANDMFKVLLVVVEFLTFVLTGICDQSNHAHCLASEN